MTAPRRCLMIGAGGLARRWIRDFYAPHRERVAIIGLVDVNAEVLAQQGDFLGLPTERRFTNMVEAFASVGGEADCCTIVIPPAVHRDAVLLAVERGLDILSEKPIADTWEACRDIYAAVTRAGLKMQVVQNYRYYQPMLTLRDVLRRGELGRINYIFARFAKDYRLYGSWGALFRHEMGAIQKFARQEWTPGGARLGTDASQGSA